MWIAAFVADAAAVDPKSVKMLWSVKVHFLLKAIQFLVIFVKMSHKWLHKNSSDWRILPNWAFYNSILDKKPFGKALQSFPTCVLINKNLCWKLFSWLESATMLDESFTPT